MGALSESLIISTVLSFTGASPPVAAQGVETVQAQVIDLAPSGGFKANLAAVDISPSLTITGPNLPVSTNQSFTVRAVSSMPATAEHPIAVIDLTSGSLLTSCTSGTSCSVSARFASMEPEQYVARQGQTETQPLSVTPAPWQLTLTTSKELVAAGEGYFLDLVTSQSPESVSGVWGVRVIDVSTGGVVNACESTTGVTGGYRCRTSLGWVPEAGRTYRGELFSTATGEVLSFSNETTVASLPWVISVEADRSHLAPDGKAVVTIHANQQIYGIRSNYLVHLVDATSSREVGNCSYLVQSGSDFTCTVSVGFPAGAATQVYAVVASVVDYAVGALAESNHVALSADAWSLRLETDRSLVKAGETYDVTAYVNGVVAAATPAQRLYVIDTTTGKVLTTCDTGYSTNSGERQCPVQLGGDPAIKSHTYVAVIASPESPDVGVTAASNSVTVAPMPWHVVWEYLRDVGPVSDASDEHRAAVASAASGGSAAVAPSTAILVGPGYPGQPGSFGAASSQSVFNTRGNYALYVQDVDTGEIFDKCEGSAYETQGTGCGGRISFDQAIDVRRVQAFVAPADDPNGVRLASTPVEYVLRARVEAALGPASRWCSGADGGLEFYGGSNYYVKDSSYHPVLYGPGAGGSGAWSGYTSYLFGAWYGSCAHIPEGGYFYQIEGYRNGMTDTIARSNVVFYPGGLGKQEQGTGGNSAENCVQACAGDPVNTATGEFFETDTDLSLSGVGPTLSWTRSYSSASSAAQQDMGYGWRSGADMRVEVVSGTSLAQAQYVRVFQENGAYVVFARDPLGKWVAPSQVFAELQDLPDGGVAFIRRDKEFFDFASDGSLRAVRDRNGNALSFTYAGGRLAHVQSDDGRWIDISRERSGRVSGVTDSAGRAVSYNYSAAGDLVAVETAAGNRAEYGYDEAHRVTSLTPPATGTTRNEYDTQSRVVRQVAPDGGVTAFSYGYYSETTVTHPDGTTTLEQYDKSRLVARTTAYGTPIAATTQFTYTSRYQVASTVDPSGRVTNFVYDVQGNLRQVVNSRNEVSTYDYDDAGDLLRVRNALGDTASLEYDANGNVSAATDALGNRFTYAVDPQGRRVATTDPLGHTGTTAYDAYSTPVSSVSAAGVVTRISADQLGRMVTSWDPRAWLPGADADDFATSYTYNSLGLLQTVTDPAGAVVSMEYDAGGRVVSTTDALGRVSTVAYDSTGRPSVETDALGRTTTYAYDLMSRVVRVARPGGAVTVLAYDALGRVTSVTDAAGGVTRFAYNAADQRTSVTDPDGRTTTYAYDSTGRLASSTDPGGGVTSYVTDELGRVTQVTDPAGRTTTYAYDAKGQVVTTELPDASLMAATYDPLGHVASTTDSQGRVSTYAYDPDGLVTRAVDVLGRETDSTYAAGYLVQQVAPDDTVYGYVYDARGYGDETTINGAPFETSVIDQVGRLESVADPAGVTAYAYDALDRVTAVAGPTGDLKYGYDVLGAMSSLTYPSGRVVARDHDLMGRLTEVSTPGVGAISYEWSPGGELEGIELPNGVDTTYGYDAAGRLASIDINGSSNPLMQLSYTYDDSGRLVQRGTERQGGGTQTEDFSSDALGRISPAGLAGPQVTYTGSHEPLELPDGSTLEFSSIGVPEGLTSGGVTTTWGYDAAGRRSTESIGETTTRQYTWDAQGTLGGVVDPAVGLDVGFEYSGGLRVAASGVNATGAIDASYVWQTVSAVPLLLGDGDFEYVYGAGSAPVAQVDAVTGDVSFLHGDVVGSTRVVTDASGGVGAEFDYGMYGSRDVVSGDADATSFLFAGEYLDPAGMYYLRSREFDPRSGVFLSVDPVLSATGMPYAYTAGNPFQGTDPLGLYGFGDLWDDAGSLAGDVWEEVSSPEFLVSAVVGIGCVAVFGPAGVLGCAAAAGAVYNAMDYSLNTPAECQSLGGYFKTVAIGAAEGYLVGVVTGPMARPIAAVVKRGLGPLVPSVMRESVSSVLQPAKNAMQRLGSALKPEIGAAAQPQSSVVVTERVAAQSLKPNQAVRRWDEFLGEGPTTNVHPRTGLPDPDRIVSSDGLRSIRFGPHEMGSSPTKFHFHEETWNFDPASNTWAVDNVLVRVPFPKGAW